MQEWGEYIGKADHFKKTKWFLNVMISHGWWDRYQEMVEDGCNFLDLRHNREHVLLINFRITVFMLKNYRAYMPAEFFEAAWRVDE